MKVVTLLLVVFLLSLLLRLFLFFGQNSSYKPSDTLEKRVVLLKEPRVRFERQNIRIEDVTVELPLEPDLHYGDTVFIRGRIEEDTFMTSAGERVRQLVVKNPEVQILPTNNPFIVSTAFIRSKIWDVFLKTIPSSEAGLLFGIVFGGTQGFSKNMADAFRSTGVLHVVAASGMNVTLVGGFLFAVFSRIFTRRGAILISISGIFYYALLAGFEASIIRASIMASIAFTATLLGRQNQAFLALIFTGWIMIMLRPENALDVGFLLSFSSTCGILFIKPFFDSLKIFLKTKGFSDDISTTISAQIGSIPFMGAFFSSYSVISIFVNTLVLWTIPFLMILGGVAAVFALFLPWFTYIPLYIALPLLWYFEKVILFFSNIPVLQFGNVPISIWIGYYLIIIAFIIMTQKKT